MNIEVERTPEALDQCHRASLRRCVVIACGFDQMVGAAKRDRPDAVFEMVVVDG